MSTSRWPVFLFLVLLFSAGGASGPTTGSAPPPVTRTSIYSDLAHGFSMTTPSFQDAKQEPIVLAIFQALPEDGFTPNVTVTIDPVRSTRADYLKASMTVMEKTNPRATVRSLRELQVSGMDAEILDYDATMTGRRLRFLQLLVVTEDRVYVLTCTAPVESFPSYQAQFQKCLDSFKLDK